MMAFYIEEGVALGVGGALVFVASDQSDRTIFPSETNLTGTNVIADRISTYSVNTRGESLAFVDLQLAKFTFEASMALTSTIMG